MVVQVQETEEEKPERVQKFMEKMNHDIQCLSDNNKMLRRRTLEKISKDLSSVEDRDTLFTIFNELIKPLLKLYSDPIDRTRELAITLSAKLCTSVQSENDNSLAYVIPTIHQRLGCDPVQEPTEEIRHLLIETLYDLISMKGKTVGIHIDEIIQILKQSIVDPFAEVKKASCNCVNKLYEVVPDKFYLQAESLVPSLLKSLSHQHYKVRLAVVKTIGVTVLGTSGKAVDDVFTHLAQRTFDHSAPVRSAVIDVVGMWLVKLMDRYSFFHKLLPLLLSGLSDDMEDIRNKSHDYFIKAGQLYEEENEKDFKERKEYDIIKHFEDLLKHPRPIIGCRSLVNRNFSKILPAISHDITDWTVSTRIKSASLLYHMVYYCEDYVTMHMEGLSQCLYTAVLDDEKEVVEKILETAELVGLFVEPKVYCKMILPYIESVASSPRQLAGCLKILAAYIRGANYRLLNDEIQKISDILVSPEISCTLTDATQQALLSCIQALTNKSGIDHPIISQNIFTISLNLLSLSNNENFKTKVHSTMDDFSRMTNMKDRFKLFNQHGNNLLCELKLSCDQWSSQSPSFFTYISLLIECGEAFGCMIENIIPIFKTCVQVGKDSEMRQRLFAQFSELVIQHSSNEEIRNILKQHSSLLVKECILPNCVWKAGRTAAALRSVVLAFLWSLFQAQVITDELLKDSFVEMNKHMTSCLDDFNVSTRLVTIKVIKKLLEVCGDSMQVEQLHAIYPEILKRMDDSSDENRIATTYALSAYFRALPENYDIEFFQAHLQYIFKALLIHLDDPKEEIQLSVLETLKDGSKVHSKMLKQLVEEARLKHRTKKYCDLLIEECNGNIRGS